MIRCLPATRTSRGAGTWHGHQFPEPGQPQPGEPTPGPVDLFHEPERSAEKRHDPEPSPTATVATTTRHREALQVIQAGKALRAGVGRYFLNSVFVTAISIVTTTLVSARVAYGLTRMHLPFERLGHRPDPRRA